MNNSNQVILIVCGLLGTGKTTLSRIIQKKNPEFTRFNTDDVRKLLGKKTFDLKDTPEVNNYMYSNARTLLDQGKSIIFDSTYKLRSAREKIYSLAKEFSARVIIIECVCSHETAIKRLTSRLGRSDGTYRPTNKEEDYHEYAKLWEDTIPDLSHSFVSLIRANTETYKIALIKSQDQETTSDISKKVQEALNEMQR